MSRSFGLLASVLMLGLASTAHAQEKVKIGLLVTLSGPPAAVGQHIRNGAELALTELGGKLGGQDVEFVIQDDELKPDVAVTKAKAMVERDHVSVVIGPVFSNILQAIIKPITDNDAILISPNPGTSNFAGKQCNPNFFVTSIQNDQGTEALGKYANDNAIKEVISIVPNYQAGRDMVGGFKRTFKGDMADEMYVPLNQLDFSAELARIAAAKPPAIFAFLPGGMGVNFIKQLNQAGLSGKVKVLSVFTADEVALPAQGEAAIGVLAGTHWTPTIDNDRNKKFVANYEQTYNHIPSNYSANGYDTIYLLDAALKASKGKADAATLRDAIKKADFKSVRGKFKFNTNHYPIQDILVSEVKKRPDGKFETEVVQTVFNDYQDHYVSECQMQ